MKVLITGFDPFGDQPINPAYEAVKKLPATIAGAEIVKLEIPTVDQKGLAKVIEQIEIEQPDVVINVGQAGGRFNISPEKVAINFNNFRIKDNEGNQPLNQAISQTGETAYFTTLPVNKMVEEMQKAGIPSTVSYTAGTFVCNQVMYGVLEHVTTNQLPIRAGFIHIPYMMEQACKIGNVASLSLETLTKGLEICIEACVTTTEDVKGAFGEID